jgi:bisphosphoglycerate-independent phosphoglycerate mutase (AlkP superfamily)
VIVSNHELLVSAQRSGDGLITNHGNTGGLADIAPTMLKILGLKQPKEMTGKSLVSSQ